MLYIISMFARTFDSLNMSKSHISLCSVSVLVLSQISLAPLSLSLSLRHIAATEWVANHQAEVKARVNEEKAKLKEEERLKKLQEKEAQRLRKKAEKDKKKAEDKAAQAEAAAKAAAEGTVEDEPKRRKPRGVGSALKEIEESDPACLRQDWPVQLHLNPTSDLNGMTSKIVEEDAKLPVLCRLKKTAVKKALLHNRELNKEDIPAVAKHLTQAGHRHVLFWCLAWAELFG